VYAQSKYPVHSGLLFANPVPAESEVPKAEMDVIIEKALVEADQAGIIGAANTPYVLKRIKELSAGKSVPANRALISANVIRGTKVAVELAELELEEKGVLER
jgi:pseudouridine-5'-phosphate glycosidase/pseudouridine kinase